MKSRRNVRKNRKSRKIRRGGKTVEDNQRNCMAYYDNNRSERDRLCDKEQLKYPNGHLWKRMYPGWAKRRMGEKYGSPIDEFPPSEVLNSYPYK